MLLWLSRAKSVPCHSIHVAPDSSERRPQPEAEGENYGLKEHLTLTRLHTIAFFSMTSAEYCQPIRLDLSPTSSIFQCSCLHRATSFPTPDFDVASTYDGILAYVVANRVRSEGLTNKHSISNELARSCDWSMSQADIALVCLFAPLLGAL